MNEQFTRIFWNIYRTMRVTGIVRDIDEINLHIRLPEFVMEDYSDFVRAICVGFNARSSPFQSVSVFDQVGKLLPADRKPMDVAALSTHSPLLVCDVWEKAAEGTDERWKQGRGATGREGWMRQEGATLSATFDTRERIGAANGSSFSLLSAFVLRAIRPR